MFSQLHGIVVEYSGLFLFFINLFNFGYVGSSLLHRLSLVVVRRGYSSLWCTGFSLWWLLLLQSSGSRHTGFSSCGTRAQQLWVAGSRVQAQQLWHMALVTPRHVGSSWTRAPTMSPALAGGFLTTAPPGKSSGSLFNPIKQTIIFLLFYTNSVCLDLMRVDQFLFSLFFLVSDISFEVISGVRFTFLEVQPLEVF